MNGIRILKTHLLFKLLRRVSSLCNCMLFASPSKFCLRWFFFFFNNWDTLLSIYSLFFMSVVTVFLWYELVMAYLLSRENEHELCSFCRFSGIIIRGPNCSEKDRHQSFTRRGILHEERTHDKTRNFNMKVSAGLKAWRKYWTYYWKRIA